MNWNMLNQSDNLQTLQNPWEVEQTYHSTKGLLWHRELLATSQLSRKLLAARTLFAASRRLPAPRALFAELFLAGFSHVHANYHACDKSRPGHA
jgi:hypothetical protein